jgi:glycosyltransferase involved in cell wall biosynthesis
MQWLIVHSDAGQIGGVEKLVAQLSALLSVDGEKVVVVSREHSGPDSAYAGIATHKTLLSRAPKSLSAGLESRPLLRPWKIFIAVLSKFYGYLVGGMRLARLVRTFDTDEYIVVCAHRIMLPYIIFAGIPSRKLILWVHRPVSHWRQTRFRWLRARYEFGYAGLVVTLTKVDAVTLRSMGYKALSIANPVTVPSELSPSARPAVVWLGRMVEVKRLDILINAFSYISDRFPGWTLRLIGSGPSESAVRAMVNDLHMNERVDFVGELVDPLPCLHAGDVFAMCSDVEGWPLALMEASAAGMAPVIRHFGPVVDEVFEHADSAEIVTGDDAVSFAAGLARVMDDSAYRERLAAQARSHMKSFDSAAFQKQWTDAGSFLNWSRSRKERPDAFPERTG